MSAPLTTAEHRLLWALVASGGEGFNDALGAAKRPRESLKRARLIEVEMRKRQARKKKVPALYLRLTDAGWARCNGDMAWQKPRGKAERFLNALLQRLKVLFERQRSVASLADFIVTSTPEAAPPAAPPAGGAASTPGAALAPRIRAACLELGGGREAVRVRLADLRRQLADVPTDETHLLNAVQDQLVERGFGFVLVDMTDVRDFWETVAQGYITSLQNVLTNERVQYKVLIERFIGFLSVNASTAADNVRKLAERKSAKLRTDLDTVLAALAQKHQRETLNHQDTVRALICLNSNDFGIANMGSSWLQGLDIDEALGRELKFQKKNQPPIEIVRSLSWLMSLTGPTVLAFEQLDPIVHQVARQTTVENAAEQHTARWIIDQIGNGLGAIRDVTTRTMAVVSSRPTRINCLVK